MSTRPRKTILYLDHSPTIGGASKVLIQILEGLNRSEVHPIVVCDRASELFTFLTQRGVRTVPASMPWFTKQSGPLTWIRYFVSLIAFTRLVGRLVRTEQVSAIHANGFIAALYAALPARIYRVPMLWHMHDVLERGFVNGLFIRFAGRAADRIACASGAVRDRLVEFGVDRSKCTVLYNCLQRPPDNENGVDIREAFHIPAHARIIGTIGNIAPLKGQKILLEAMLGIADVHPDVVCLIIGDTIGTADEGYKKELQAGINECGFNGRIICTGRRPDAFRLLGQFDILVHPATLPDAMPLVLLEAMYHGKPIIATAVGGIPEMVSQGVNGILIPPDDPAALADALDSLLRDRKKMCRMGSEGKRMLQEKFQPMAFFSNLYSLYRELTEKPERRIPEEKPKQA